MVACTCIDYRHLWRRPLMDSLPTTLVPCVEKATSVGGTGAAPDGSHELRYVDDVPVCDARIFYTGRPAAH